MSVHRVRLESGEERSYGTLEELVADVDAGIITTRAQIFHAASAAWLSVTQHPLLLPHFVDAPLAITGSSDFLSTLAPTAPHVPPPPPQQAEVEPSLDGDLPPLPDYRPPSEWKSDRSYAALFRVLGLTVVLATLGGGGWYAWHTWAERQTARAIAEAEAADTVVRAQPVDTIPDSVLAKALETLRAADTAGMGRAREITLRDRFSGVPLRPIDKLRTMTPVELRRSYAASYAAARAAMDSDFVAAGVIHLFSTARLATPDSLRAGLQLVQAARNILRVYLSNEVQIERAFRDTIAFQTSKSGWATNALNEWKARAILKESYEGAQLADSMLQRIDELYILLLDQAGRYRVGGGRIAFDDAGAGNDYARLAGWLTARYNTIDAIDDQAEPQRSHPTARRVVRAFTGTRPPTREADGPASASMP